ncbi:MAG: hypothetical protein P8012_16225 [Desulfobacterales bacterium]
MEKVVDIQAYRAKVFKKRAFGPWQKRFDESYGIDIKLSELSDKTLYFLAQPGENSSSAYYELIMGILDFGPAAKFNYLSNREQMRVVDIHLFLADQVRFEIMRRLKWLAYLPCKTQSLVQMVQDFDTAKPACKATPPELAESHPDYDAYRQLAHGDKEVFIRRMLWDALETFKDRLG